LPPSRLDFIAAVEALASTFPLKRGRGRGDTSSGFLVSQFGRSLERPVAEAIRHRPLLSAAPSSARKSW